MKFIDCFMYYDEDLVLDLRLNILNEYVSYFVIPILLLNTIRLKKK